MCALDELEHHGERGLVRQTTLRREIINAVVKAAKAGDSTAMRLCVERLVPLRKGRPVVFDLPPVKTAADIAGAVGELSRATAAGELTTDEASAAASVIETHCRAIETHVSARAASRWATTSAAFAPA